MSKKKRQKVKRSELLDHAPIKVRFRQALVSEDLCPICLGELDEGFQCNDCDYDAVEDRYPYLMGDFIIDVSSNSDTQSRPKKRKKRRKGKGRNKE